MVKKIVAGLLTVGILLASFTSCKTLGNSEEIVNPDIAAERARFDEFLEQDFMEYVTSSTLTLHNNLRNPEEYGITDTEVSWGDLAVYPSEESLEEDRAIIEEFNTFDRSKLTLEQQQSYDIYAYDISYYDESLDTWFLYDPFTGSNGLHMMLPVVLGEYVFYREKDVEDYLTLLSMLDEMFDSLLAFEAERSKLGLFLSDSAVDDIIDGCETFLSDDTDNILINSFENRLAKLQGIDDSRKQELISKNQELFDTVVVPSYQKFMEGMAALKGTGVNDGGLAHFEKGKDYYRKELKSIGVGSSPEELIAKCDQELDELTQQFFSSRAEGVTSETSIIAPPMSLEETLAFLKEESASFFPEVPDGLSYSLKTIDKSVEDYVSPGFYFTPPIDDYGENSIYVGSYIAEETSVSRFFLLAHEGFPGHLYQFSNILSSSLPDWRKVRDYSANVEGWAQYAEFYSYRFFPDQKKVANYMRINEEFDYVQYLRIDLGIHYQGWNMEDLVDYLHGLELYQHIDKETISGYFEGTYRFTIDNPMQIVPYVAGMFEIRDMADYFETKLKKSFDDYTFHEHFLSYGVAPLPLIREWMEEDVPEKSWFETLFDAA